MVKRCLDHTNHSSTMGHMRIPNETGQRIAGKLSRGIAIQAFLDEIRNEVEGGITRNHLVDRKDVINVKYQFNIDLMEKDPKDTTSVHYWVKELEKQDFNPVLVYKPQGIDRYSLPNNDCLLGIQTKYQLDTLIVYGNKVIIWILHIRQHNMIYSLYLFLSIDDFWEGLPVAWLISNREDQLVLSPFLQEMSRRCGQIATKTFMPDDANNFYNSWTAHFPTPEKKLLCMACG